MIQSVSQSVWATGPTKCLMKMDGQQGKKKKNFTGFFSREVWTGPFTIWRGKTGNCNMKKKRKRHSIGGYCLMLSAEIEKKDPK